MAKVTTAQIPKRESARTIHLPADVLAEAVSDLAESVDWMPHAYTDGKEYKTYSDAAGVARVTVREVAGNAGKTSHSYATKVWEKNGGKDRKANGKWLFAITQRSVPRKPRTRKTEAEQNS